MGKIPILDSITGWFKRCFSDPEAVTLFLFLVSVLFLIQMFGATLEPILVSVVLAYLLDPLVKGLERSKMPHWLAVSIVFLVFIGAVVLFLVVLVPLLWRQVIALGHEIPSVLPKVQEYVNTISQKHPDLLSANQLQNIVTGIKSDAAHVGRIIFSYSLSSISIGFAFIMYLILVPTIVFFILKDRDSILNWFRGYMPGHSSLIRRVWKDVHLQIASYVRGRVIEIILVSIVTWVVFAVLGLHYGTLLAVATGISVIVPYIGIVLVIIPVVIVALLQWGLGLHFAYLIISFLVICTLDAYVLVPKLFSGILNLSPVVIIVSVLIFGSIWGFWGVFLAIPLAAVIKAVLDAWPRSKSTTTTC
jgi:putative permease